MANGASDRLAIIVGAGASYDCADRRTARYVNEKFRPPLARDIFSNQFDEILSRYRTLEARLDWLRTKLARGENFEEIFRKLLDSAERNQLYWPLQVPMYLRDLFWTVSQEYLQGSSKFDTLVQRTLESSTEKVLFLNLNYDLLLDSALTNHDRHEFSALSSYVPQSKKWLYVKAHGSVNWARTMSNCPGNGQGLYHPGLLNAMPEFCSEVTIVRRNPMSGDFYIPSIPSEWPVGYLYPQVVVPTDKPKEFVCPKQHIDQVRAFLRNCGILLFIGFSGRDEHIVGLLRAIPRGSRLVIVSKVDARAVFDRMSVRLPGLKSKGLVVSFHNVGFSNFLESKAFEDLLGRAHSSGPWKKSSSRTK